MKKFKRFLSDSGSLSGFTAHEDCVDFKNTKGKKFALLYSDLEEALGLIGNRGQIIDREFNGDWSYSENKYREHVKPCLESVDANTVASNIGSQTRSTVEALELYAAFKLGESPVITNDGQLSIAYLAPQYLERAFSKQAEFEQYLKLKGLSAKSISSYLGAIKSTLSKLVSRPIFSISDLSEFKVVRARVEASEKFSELNAMGQMYQAALNHFEAYLLYHSRPLLEFRKHMLAVELYEHGVPQNLLTKPFTILTGGSGSGKTKLAESLAAALRNSDDLNDCTNHSIIPVGADWTDNRQVLGFVNHLRTSSVGEGETATERPVYQTTPVLDLLLEASRPGNERFPFFLILDEMNLSHVERYFADFLSVMEQRDGVLTLHSEGPREDEHFCLPRYAEDPLGVPRTLPYPQNLFVIGTVNVDETTYMFSPKVLDRANVIEFEVESGQIAEFLASPHEYPEPPKADEGVAEAFLALAKRARLDPDKGGLDALDGTPAKEAREHLVALFEILKRGRFEFAYRTANEVMRYLRVCRYLAAEESDDALSAWDEGGWRNDLDAQIVQKILPKLHGSMGRVGRLLGALTAYCGGADAGAAFHYFPGGREGSDSSITGLPLQNALEPVEGGGHRFSKSRTKLETMIQVLLEEQFVSFIN